MKKQHKIVSLLLVLSLLLGSLVFTTSAADAGDDTAAVSDGDTFTPTATFSNSVNFSDYKSSSAVNHLTSTMLAQLEDDYVAQIVTPANGGTKYLQITSQADDDGVVDKQFQFTFYANDGSALFYDINNPIYVVYEMDIATESDLVHLNLGARIANASNSDKGGVDSKSLLGEGNLIDFSAGQFHRYTHVQDFDNNKVYHFVDNTLVYSTYLLSTACYDAWKANSADGTYGNTGVLSSLKIQSHSSYTNTPLVEGETLLVANAKATVLRGTTAAGDLPAALAANSIVSWTERSTAELPTIPDLVEIDGVRYNSVKKASEVLSIGTTPKNVEILRDSAAKIHVACSAVINTHGYDVLTYADHVTTSTSGDIVTVTNNSFTSTALTTSVDNTTKGAATQHVKANTIGNMFSSVGNNQYYFVANGRGEKIYTNTFTGNSYVYDTVFDSGNNSLDAYSNWSPTKTYYYTQNADEYVIIEFDAAADNYSDNSAYGQVTSRGGSGSPNGGYSLSPVNVLSGAGIAAGDFARISFVCDPQTNTGYIFVNGKLYDNVSKALGSAGVSAANADYFSEFRWYGKTGSFYYDNVYFAFVTDSGMTSDIKSEAFKNNKCTAYTLGGIEETNAPLAIVNGTVYTTSAELENALYTNDKLTVEFFRQPASAVTVRANATVYTNGFTNTVTAYDESVTLTENGNVITVTAPYIENALVETAITSDAETKNALYYPHPGNLYGTAGKVSTNGTGTKAYEGLSGMRIPTLASNPITGDTFYHETSDGTTGTTMKNEYLNFWNSTGTLINMIEGQNQYYVMDIDIATVGTLTDGQYSFGAYVRGSATLGSGTGYWGGNISLKNIAPAPTNGMVHLTVVFDLDNNAFHAFVDGVYNTSTSGKVMSDAGHSYYTGADTSASAYFQGVKFGSNSNMDIYLNNYCIRYVSEAEGAESSLSTAITNKNIKSWSDDFLANGYVVPQFPALATIDGVEYSSVTSVNAALNAAALANEKIVNVEFLHTPESLITINCDSIVKTNGLSNIEFSEDCAVADKGDNVYKVTAPNFTDSPIYTESEWKNLIVSTNSGNAISSITFNNIAISDSYTNPTEGRVGFTKGYTTYNIDDGSSYFTQKPVDVVTTSNSDSNTYSVWDTSKTFTYSSSQSQYAVLDFDIKLEGGDGSKFNIYTVTKITPVSTGIQSSYEYYGNNITTSFLSGTDGFVHVTMLYNMIGGDAYVFVNNTMVGSERKGSAHKYITAGNTFVSGDQINFRGFRVGPNAQEAVSYKNAYCSFVTDSTAAAELDSAITSGTLSNYSGKVYGAGYAMPTAPSVANVNGENVSYGELERLFTSSRDKLNVEFNHCPTSPITIKVDATIETHGWAQDSLITLGANTTATTEGTVVYVDGPFVESANAAQLGSPSAAVGSGYFQNVIDTNVNDNLVTGVSEANNGSFLYYEQSNFDSNNPYYVIKPYVTEAPKNTFLGVTTNGNLNYTNDSYKLGASSYFVFDMDVASDYEMIKDLSIAIHNIYTTDESVNTYSNPETIKISNYVTAGNEWVHLTLVGDIANNRLYVYVNGEDVSLGTERAYNANGDYGIPAGLYQTRINIPGGAALDKSHTTWFDNVSMRKFDSASVANGLADAISGKDLTAWSGYAAGRSGETLPAVATVDGVSYGNVHVANEALISEQTLAVFLEKAPFGGKVTVSAPSVLVHNGIEYEIADYVSETLKDGVVITSIEDMLEVSVVINESVVYEDEVLPGTDVKAILEENGSFFAEEIENNVVAGNGHIFTNVSWEYAPTLVAGDVTFSATADKYTELFYAYDEEGAAVEATYNAAGLREVLQSAGVYNVILGDSVEMPAGTTNLGANTKKLYMNEHSMSFPASTNHSFSAGGSYAGSLEIHGPGRIDDTKHNNSQQLLFASYGWTGTFTIKNLDVDLSTNVANLRDGNLVVDGCTVNCTSLYNNQFIQIGEMYSGYTQAPIHVDIIDSYVNFRSYATSTSFIKQIALSGSKKYDNTDLGFTLADHKHELNIEGSTIITEAAVFEYVTKSPSQIDGSYNYHTSTHTDVSSGMVTKISDSKIVGSTFVYNTGASVTINIGNNTSVNSALHSNAQQFVADGLEAVKSNDNLADVTYTSNYANVTWADGTTEKWASLSTPVGSNSFSKVQTVIGSVDYVFDEAYEAAPFSMSVNLTLGSSIGFNVYVPYDSTVISVVVNGETITAKDKKINNVLYKCYTVELAPSEAAVAFDVIFNLKDGNTVAMELSAAKYASLVYGAYTDTNTVNMMSNTLNYIKASATYFGVNADLSAINTLLSAHPATLTTLPTSSSNTGAGVSEYVTGMQLNIMSTMRFRFNVADGADPTKVKIYADGVEKELIIGATFVEIELHAYEMTKVITINYDGLTGNIDLAYYCAAVNNGKGTATGQATSYSMRSYQILYTRGGMLQAIYSYAAAAAAYKA